MERDTDMECGPSAPYLGNGKSKLDTLSKEDLIKFAKKQMAVMQKLKAKCADLEKEVEVQKTLPGGISDNSVIQELTGRIDAVLLEKAETEQNFVLLQNENEQIKKQAAEAMENLLQLQEKLENEHKEHMESIKVLEKNFETSETKHREEMKLFKQIQRQRQIEEFNSNFEAVRQEFESQVNNLQHDLELAKQQQTTEIEALVDTHQMALKKCHENLQNLHDEIARLQTQHEEDIGVLQEQLEMNAAHFDMERERFLKELAEQQVLKENFLQDVDEEEEDFNSGTQKASGILKLSDTLTLEEPNERLRLTLQELQSQNVMLQEELAFLTNVKTELESNLKHIKEEFMMEREELEFKINELQMMKGDPDACLEKEVQILNELKTVSLEKHEQGLQELRELHKTEIKELETHLICNAECEKEPIIQELKDLQYQCKVLAEEKTAVISEYEHTKEVLKTLEVELSERTSDFVKQYTAMKKHAATSIQELQEKLLEKDNVIEKLKSVVQTTDNLECKAQMLLNIKNEDVLDELHKEECLVQDVGEIPNIMDADKEIVPRLEKIRTDIEHMLDECKFGQMDTVQLPPQALEHLSVALEGALAERKRLRNWIVHLEGQVSLSSSKKLRKCCDTLLEDQAALHDTEQQTGSQTQAEASCAVEEQTELPSTLVESKALCRVSEMLKQKYSVIIAEEDIPALLNQLLSIVKKGNMIFTQQCNYQAGQTQASQQALQQQEACGEHQLQKTSEIEVLPHFESFQGDHTEMQTRNEEICPGDSEHLSEGQRTACTQKPSHETGTQEVDDLKHLQHEKEAIIAQLKEEISLLQEFKMSTCNKNLTRIEILEKEIKEKDERMNKIKAVAVKAKKELENSKKEASALREELEAMQAARDKLSDSMKGIIHSAEDYRNLMTSYDKQSEQLDKEREKVEGAERLVGDLTKRLQTAIEQHKQLCSEREDMAALIETLHSNVHHLEAQAQEMLKKTSGLERDLEAENLIKQQKAKEHQSTVKELEEMRALLQKQKHHLQQTEEELEQLRKDAQQSTLLDMEMADYERLVKELNVQLTEKDKLLDKQVSMAQAQRDKEEKMHQEMESLKSLVDIGEEKSSKMKQLLVKTKKDLADAKKEEASQMMIQSSLKGELEGTLQQLESYKIQCSELQAERHRLQEELKVVSEQYQKACSSFQTQISTLQNQLASTQAELCSTLSEFESYKVRVHNVLKQQKSKSSSLCDGEFSKQERDHMQSLVEQLRSKLQEVQQQLQSSSAELQQLQTEHDMLLDRHSKMLQHTVTKEAELRERLLSLHSENSALRSEHSQSVAQLTAQADVLRTSFREQVHHLQAEQRSTVETLQQQISRLEAQLFQLQQEPCSTGSAPLQQSRKPHHPDRKLGDMPVCELQNMAREEGEGMETTEMESLSTASSPPPTLEQLLTSTDPKQEPFVWQAEPSKEELSQKLNTATRSMEHMNSLLHESEATNAVLMEQISLLKSELRRLERNQEREKCGANLEYLKNVLLRFMLLQAGSEKQALLPVIHTLLQLSPDEKSKLAAIAQGEEEAANSGRSGWTSYIHSWSGIR